MGSPRTYSRTEVRQRARTGHLFPFGEETGPSGRDCGKPTDPVLRG